MTTDRRNQHALSMRSLIALAGAAIVSAAIGTAYLARTPQRASVLAERKSVDLAGHRRGVVQIDLMRQIMSDNARSSRSSSLETIGQAAAERLPASNHPLLGRPAPDFELNNQDGTRWRLSQHLSEGPVVVVFYLGMTCLACVSHLVEFDSRWDELRDAGAQLVAISPDESNFTRDRFDRFGALAFPALADPERTVAKAYGAWRPNAALSAGEPLHATFLIERNGQVRWAWVGDRPFMDIPAMLLELDQARNDALTTNETRKAQP